MTRTTSSMPSAPRVARGRVRARRSVGMYCRRSARRSQTTPAARSLVLSSLATRACLRAEELAPSHAVKRGKFISPGLNVVRLPLRHSSHVESCRVAWQWLLAERLSGWGEVEEVCGAPHVGGGVHGGEDGGVRREVPRLRGADARVGEVGGGEGVGGLGDDLHRHDLVLRKVGLVVYVVLLHRAHTVLAAGSETPPCGMRSEAKQQPAARCRVLSPAQNTYKRGSGAMYRRGA